MPIDRLPDLGLEVSEGIGRHGVVGVLRNGPGPVVLLRAELDALPILEQTGLPYQSTQYMEDWWGRRQPVMHACGHDMHMANLMGAEEIHAGKPGSDWVSHLDIVLDVKAYDPAIRTKLIDGIKEVVEREASDSGANKAPEITTSVRAPLTSNDATLPDQLQIVFSGFFGSQNVLNDLPSHPCEDFSRLATAVDAPYVFWWIGRADPADLRRAREEGRLLDAIPIEQSPFNAPLIYPTLETGIHAFSLAALSVLRAR